MARYRNARVVGRLRRNHRGSLIMKVYTDEVGAKRLVGRADIAESEGPVYQVALFGASSSIVDNFTIGSVTYLPAGGGMPIVERAVLLSPGQRPEVLPGWQTLAS